MSKMSDDVVDTGISSVGTGVVMLVNFDSVVAVGKGVVLVVFIINVFVGAGVVLAVLTVVVLVGAGVVLVVLTSVVLVVCAAKHCSPFVLVCPAGQSEHVSRPTLVLFVPIGHALQSK